MKTKGLLDGLPKRQDADDYVHPGALNKGSSKPSKTFTSYIEMPRWGSHRDGGRCGIVENRYQRDKMGSGLEQGLQNF